MHLTKLLSISSNLNRLQFQLFCNYFQTFYLYFQFMISFISITLILEIHFHTILNNNLIIFLNCSPFLISIHSFTTNSLNNNSMSINYYNIFGLALQWTKFIIFLIIATISISSYFYLLTFWIPYPINLMYFVWTSAATSHFTICTQSFFCAHLGHLLHLFTLLITPLYFLYWLNLVMHFILLAVNLLINTFLTLRSTKFHFVSNCITTQPISTFQASIILIISIAY